jgi:hypothetical protein
MIYLGSTVRYKQSEIYSKWYRKTYHVERTDDSRQSSPRRLTRFGWFGICYGSLNWILFFFSSKFQWDFFFCTVKCRIIQILTPLSTLKPIFITQTIKCRIIRTQWLLLVRNTFHSTINRIVMKILKKRLYTMNNIVWNVCLISIKRCWGVYNRIEKGSHCVRIIRHFTTNCKEMLPRFKLCDSSHFLRATFLCNSLHIYLYIYEKSLKEMIRNTNNEMKWMQ